MQPTARNFDVPDLNPKQLLDRLSQSLTLECDSEQSFTRTFYDSFDWRLYTHGYLLTTEKRSNQLTLLLQSLHNNTQQHTINITQSPKFCDDLPAGFIKQQLTPLLDMRALLTQAQIQCAQQHIKQLNKDRKTVLRLNIEQNQLHTATQTQPLCHQILLSPIKGYRKPFEKTLQLIQTDLELVENKHNLLIQALAVNNRKPMDYSSKLNIPLSADMRSDQACRLILKALLAAMLVNEEGTRKDIDSEFLHDFRVAIRRTRSALSQLKRMLPSEDIVPFTQSFAHLGHITGPTRDLDVYLLDFNTYKASLPILLQDDLDPLHVFLQKKQKQAHRTLLRHLNSKDYKNLIERWQSYLQSPLSDNPYFAMPAQQLANTRIWKVYRRVLKDGQSIDEQTEAETLHDLRKTCKKLRYLMEFFQTLYPAKAIKALIKALKGLQDNLGRHQDYEVQTATVKQFAVEMAKSGTPAETLMAMGVLAQGLDHRRQQARDEFSQRFAEFDTAKLHSKFEHLFKKIP